jgi:tRNA threonylcarbamoyladenosine biosynthesis protein TsaE
LSTDIVVQTTSPEETLELGTRLGELLFPGAVLALVGELGSGKTMLTKGLARGLGVQEYQRVCSPTFMIKQEYVGRLPIHHYDAYRLGGSDELGALGFEEDLFSGGVAVVEWADLVPTLIPGTALQITLEHGAGDSAARVVDNNADADEIPEMMVRTLSFRGEAVTWRSVLEKLKFPYSRSRNRVE